eukprot:10994408-Heterocapsa_arctica.AAC.1
MSRRCFSTASFVSRCLSGTACPSSASSSRNVAADDPVALPGSAVRPASAVGCGAPGGGCGGAGSAAAVPLGARPIPVLLPATACPLPWMALAGSERLMYTAGGTAPVMTLFWIVASACASPARAAASSAGTLAPA